MRIPKVGLGKERGWALQCLEGLRVDVGAVHTEGVQRLPLANYCFILLKNVNKLLNMNS